MVPYNYSLSSMRVVSSALQSQGIPVIQYTLKHLEGKIVISVLGQMQDSQTSEWTNVGVETFC